MRNLSPVWAARSAPPEITEPALKLASGQVGVRSAVLIVTAVSLDGAALEGG